MMVRQWFAGLALAWLFACGSSSSPERPSAQVGSSSATPAAATGSAGASGPCGALERLRPKLYAVELEELESSDWTWARPTDQKHAAAEAAVAAILSACVSDRWSQDAIDCFVAGADDDRAQAGSARCKSRERNRTVERSIDRATTAALTRMFGPPPDLDDALEKYGEQMKQRAAKKAAGVEPLVTIPSRYAGFAWFTREAGPLFQVPGAPACVQEVLANVEGYYQTQSLDHKPSLIAVLGTINRPAAEACLQRVLAAQFADARLERDGAITRITAGAGASYLGWAGDGTMYSHRDRDIVEEALAQRTTITSNAEVMALVAKVDHRKATWFVVSADFTSKLIGVPSTGVRFDSDLLASKQKYSAAAPPRIPLTVELASTADARRFAAALRAPHTALSPALQAQIAKLSPAIHDRDVELDIAPIFTQPSLFQELTDAVNRLGEAK